MPNEPVVHIIDDDAAARDALAFLLDCSEIATRTYASAVEFLGAVPTMERGCIITDVRMPEMSGLELVGGPTELPFDAAGNLAQERLFPHCVRARRKTS